MDADVIFETFKKTVKIFHETFWRSAQLSIVYLIFPTNMRLVQCFRGLCVLGQHRNSHTSDSRQCYATPRLAVPLGTPPAPRLQPLGWASIWQPSLSPENGVGRPAQGMLPEYFIGLRGIQTACKVDWGHGMADCPNFWVQFCVKFQIKIKIWGFRLSQR
jgi:hypothetical protein